MDQHRRRTTDLENGEVVVHAIKASISISPLDPLSVATHIQSREPADAHRVHPTGKIAGLDAFGVVPPAHRTHQISPRLVIQFRRIVEIAARIHHFSPVIGTWSLRPSP